MEKSVNDVDIHQANHWSVHPQGCTGLVEKNDKKREKNII